jgi:hypothetical protein
MAEKRATSRRDLLGGGFSLAAASLLRAAAGEG